MMDVISLYELVLEMTAVTDKALNKFGVKHQLGKTKEECAELIVALDSFLKQIENKSIDVLKDDDSFKTSSVNVVDELADVFITAFQAAIVLGEGKVRDRIAFKLNRLKNLIENS
jgi:hypothetical protein